MDSAAAIALAVESKDRKRVPPASFAEATIAEEIHLSRRSTLPVRRNFLASCHADVPGHPEIEDEYRETCLEIQRNCEIYNQEFSIGRRHRRTAGS